MNHLALQAIILINCTTIIYHANKWANLALFFILFIVTNGSYSFISKEIKSHRIVCKLCRIVAVAELHIERKQCKKFITGGQGLKQSYFYFIYLIQVIMKKYTSVPYGNNFNLFCICKKLYHSQSPVSMPPISNFRITYVPI